MHWSNYDTKLTSGVLFGNKAIADYLGVSLATLKRLKQRHDLPIVKLDYHRCFASAELLDAFFITLAAQSIRNRNVKRRDPSIVGGVGEALANMLHP